MEDVKIKVKNRFKIENYPGNYVMHCPESWQAEVFCQYLHSVGRTRKNGKVWPNNDLWGLLGCATCYIFNEGLMIDYPQAAEDSFYTILEFSDFEWWPIEIPYRVRPSKQEYYLGIAKAVAQRSTCIRRQYGAVIVKDDEIISTGYNGSPRGRRNCIDYGFCNRIGHEHNDGDYSSCPAVHAEQNAIISAARKDMQYATLYLYGEENGVPIEKVEPCPKCMDMIINAGLRVVTPSKENI